MKRYGNSSIPIGRGEICKTVRIEVARYNRIGSRDADHLVLGKRSRARVD